MFEATQQELDAASRIKDTYDLHRVVNLPVEILGKWFSFSIEDGKSNGDLYDRRYQAIAHVSDERLYGYVQMQLGDMSAREALSLLRFYRQVYRSGCRVSAPPDEQNIERLMFGGFGK